MPRWRKVTDNVLLPVELHGWDVNEYKESASQLIRLVGLEGFEDRYPRELSGGMQQRVSICRAFVQDPPLLLMDEPFGALGAITRDEMNLELLKIWRGRRKTILFVTHSISEAVFLADRVAIMTPRPGRIISSLKINFPMPRNIQIRDTRKYTKYVSTIREKMGLRIK